MGEDITKRFQVHKVDDQQTLHFMSLMRRNYAELALELTTRLPPGRELSVALTKLEEAMFWTSAAIARTVGEPSGYGDVPVPSPVDEPQDAGHDPDLPRPNLNDSQRAILFGGKAKT